MSTEPGLVFQTRVDVRADSAFVAGQTHVDNAKACQDYAYAGSIGGAAHSGPLYWTAVSDGCSTGGNTDIGARMWVHAARLALERSGFAALQDLRSLKESLLSHVGGLLAPFERQDALATLVLAASDGASAQAALFGDGLVALRHADGTTSTWEVTYEHNAPRYLAYELGTDNESMLEAWRDMVGNSLVQVRTGRLANDGSVLETHCDNKPAWAYPGLWLSFEDVSQFEALLVVTDGVQSFEGVAPEQSLQELLAVKNPTGQFLQRRFGAMARSWRKGSARMPQDDLGAGVLWFLASTERGA